MRKEQESWHHDDNESIGMTSSRLTKIVFNNPEFYDFRKKKHDI